MKKKFYSNGKLLLTGEYLVLDGAKAFALPTKFGQDLTIEETTNQTLSWTSFDADGSIWFEDTIPFSSITSSTLLKEFSIKNTLITILKTAHLMNSKIIEHSNGFCVSTTLNFPRKWGLGTSSTLINNIAQWFEINAFELLNLSFGGSGYDIACAQNNCPIIYQLLNEKPIVKKVNFNPSFTENIYFVYLNQKQSSKNAIAAYKEKKHKLANQIESISALTESVSTAINQQQFSEALELHEQELSSILETKTVKENLFPDFEGTLKSLGAWGGDFIMVISQDNPNNYFKEKGFETIIPYHEMIL
jgi:mevalonate kinase